MSQPPYPFDPSQMYGPPPVPARPTAIMVLGIAGIAFGSIGVLCIGFSTAFSIAVLLNPQLSKSLQQPPNSVQWPQVVLGLCGFLLSLVLLIGSIGSLMLKPAARRIMLGWAPVDLVYNFVKMVVTFFIIMPAMTRNMPAQQTPNGPQMVMFARAGAAVGGIATWLITSGLALAVFVVYRRPEIVAAFERGGAPPGGPQFVPPPPPQSY